MAGASFVCLTQWFGSIFGDAHDLFDYWDVRYLALVASPVDNLLGPPPLKRLVSHSLASPKTIYVFRCYCKKKKLARSSLRSQGTLTRDIGQRFLLPGLSLLWFLWRRVLGLVFWLHLNILQAPGNLLLNALTLTTLVRLFPLALRSRPRPTLPLAIFNHGRGPGVSCRLRSF